MDERMKRPGEVLEIILEKGHFDQYRIKGKPMQGGMGVVVKALDTRMKRTVALKFLKPPSTGPSFLEKYDIEFESRFAQAAKRFEKEAPTLAKIKHSSVLTIYDCGTVEKVLPFYSAEFLQGKDLSDHKRLNEDQDLVRQWMIQVLSGLKVCHEHGIIHRDIKPQNIIITEEGRAVLFDFGIAWDQHAATVLTATGQAPGTANYMAPEQLDWKYGAISASTDLYALGATFFEVLTGQKAFDGDTDPAIQHRKINYPPPNIEEYRPDIDPRLAVVIRKSLRKESERRFESAADAIEILEKESWEVKAPPGSVIVRLRRNRRRRWFVGVGVFTILVLSLVFFGLFILLDEPPETSSLEGDKSPIENVQEPGEQLTAEEPLRPSDHGQGSDGHDDNEANTVKDPTPEKDTGPEPVDLETPDPPSTKPDLPDAQDSLARIRELLASLSPVDFLRARSLLEDLPKDTRNETAARIENRVDHWKSTEAHGVLHHLQSADIDSALESILIEAPDGGDPDLKKMVMELNDRVCEEVRALHEKIEDTRRRMWRAILEGDRARAALVWQEKIEDLCLFGTAYPVKSELVIIERFRKAGSLDRFEMTANESEEPAEFQELSHHVELARAISSELASEQVKRVLIQAQECLDSGKSGEAKILLETHRDHFGVEATCSKTLDLYILVMKKILEAQDFFAAKIKKDRRSKTMTLSYDIRDASSWIDWLPVRGNWRQLESFKNGTDTTILHIGRWSHAKVRAVFAVNPSLSGEDLRIRAHATPSGTYFFHLDRDPGFPTCYFGKRAGQRDESSMPRQDLRKSIRDGSRLVQVEVSIEDQTLTARFPRQAGPWKYLLCEEPIPASISLFAGGEDAEFATIEIEGILDPEWLEEAIETRAIATWLCGSDDSILRGLEAAYRSSTGRGGGGFRIDDRIDFDWGRGRPDDVLPEEGFTVSWSGLLVVPGKGKYGFRIPESGGEERFKLNTLTGNTLLTSSSGAEALRRTIDLERGVYPIEFTFHSGSGHREVHLLWKRPEADDFSIIDGRFLYHLRR